MIDVVRRRVVAERDKLDPLQAHHPVALGPAPVVADHHADHAAERAPDREAQVADLEVALFQVLEWDARAVIGVAGQIDLAVLADDPAVRADQDRGVVAVPRAAFFCELGVAEVEADLELGRELGRGCVASLGISLLEPAVDLPDLVIPVGRKKVVAATPDKPRTGSRRRAPRASAPSAGGPRSPGRQRDRLARAARRRPSWPRHVLPSPSQTIVFYGARPRLRVPARGPQSERSLHAGIIQETRAKTSAEQDVPWEEGPQADRDG